MTHPVSPGTVLSPAEFQGAFGYEIGWMSGFGDYGRGWSASELSGLDGGIDYELRFVQSDRPRDLNMPSHEERGALIAVGVKSDSSMLNAKVLVIASDISLGQAGKLANYLELFRVPKNTDSLMEAAAVVFGAGQESTRGEAGPSHSSRPSSVRLPRSLDF